MARVPKCPIGQISRGALIRQVVTTPAKRQMAIVPRFKMAVCKYCHKAGHNINECRLAHNLSLFCGSSSTRLVCAPIVDNPKENTCSPSQATEADDVRTIKA